MIIGSAPSASDWLHVFPARPHAAVRLVCFPYAGAGAMIFREWAHRLPDDVEVAAVRLPGRERRIGEQPIDRMDPLLDQLAPPVADWLDRPFALFGHSMGARVAFELSRWLRRRGGPRPAHLYVSGCPAPQLPQPPALHDLPSPELVLRLREMGGVPPETFAFPELIQMMLPVLRADFAVVETFVHHPEPALDHPITAFAGTADPEATLEQTNGWREHTSHFALHSIPGGHFFLAERLDVVLGVIRRDLAELTDRNRHHGSNGRIDVIEN